MSAVLSACCTISSDGQKLN